ncbi:Gp138 family membrane-puncturing spike protein [Geoglobus acetivorans]|uniref:Uncharacterized protein n=1 Tax=Geoglobus acetivorans TaxID=565033 RepID=A0A0A7GDI8_GEOAI|nr:hypothetical protein GACE_0834 [Geoglobus acetivorans]
MIDKLLRLIDAKLDNINTVALGIVTQVDNSRLRCNVKLKHKIQGNEIELFDVPIACLRSSVGTIYVPLREGDVVLVLFSKYELEEQLKNRDTVAVNELLRFNINDALVFGGLFTLADSIPSINPDRINIIGDVYIDGDLDFKTIRGVSADSGSWHPPGV